MDNITPAAQLVIDRFYELWEGSVREYENIIMLKSAIEVLQQTLNDEL